MNIWHLITREIVFRKLNFLLAVLAVFVAVSTVVAGMTALNVQADTTKELIERQQKENKSRMARARADTNKRLAQDEKETKKELRKLEDQIRKAMLQLKFNVWIVSGEEDLGDLSAESLAVETIPYEYCKKIADSKEMTIINHLLPQVQKRTAWTEKDNYSLYVIGIEREVPFAHRKPKKDLLPAVPPGMIIVGHALGKKFKLKKGQEVQFRGKKFKIARVHRERGNRDDKTIFMNLRQCQDLYDMKDKKGQYLINAILAIECNCASIDRIGEIRTAIKKILPDVSVQEKFNAATARAVARNETKKTAIKEKERRKVEALKALQEQKQQQDAELEQTQRDRNDIQANYEMVVSILLPLAIVASLIWLGFTMLGNVRERISEIGILRALGLSSGHVYALFLTRAVLVGVIGAVVGYAIGVAGGVMAVAVADPEATSATNHYVNPMLLIGVVVTAPTLSALVTWLSATIAAQQDPAVVLREA
ncbi:MAG: ABC transporter permease [Gemmataceae bacterium]